MQPKTHVIAADRVECFLAKKDGVPGSELGGARFLSELCFEEPHAPTCEEAMWSGGNHARVAGADAWVAQKIADTGGEPTGFRENFCVDAGNKRRV